MGMTPSDRIFKIAEKLDSKGQEVPVETETLNDVAHQVGRASSGSWLGYQSRVYYEGLQIPPPGARFSAEWGLMERFSDDTFGEWEEYNFDDVVNEILRLAGGINLKDLELRAKDARDEFEEGQSELLSILSSIGESLPDDKFLIDLIEKIRSKRIFTTQDFLKAIQPNASFICRDMRAVQGGSTAPPHQTVAARVAAVKSPYASCSDLAKLARRAASHLANVMRKEDTAGRIGTNVFIGHGRAPAWRDLKDFIQDRLRLPWDEFNRVPAAGFSNIARLSTMLDSAAMAFLILTAEDELADGSFNARLNVVHEVGLFQGRLGFEKAIILLEEGCEEFSNVHGLGQIRFPKGNISAKFEEIRQVLEREGVLDP